MDYKEMWEALRELIQDDKNRMEDNLKQCANTHNWRDCVEYQAKAEAYRYALSMISSIERTFKKREVE